MTSATSLPSTYPNRHVRAAVLEGIPQQLGEDERERRRPLTRDGDVVELGRHVLADGQPLDEHCSQPVDQLVEVDDVLAVLRQLLVDGGDGEDAIDRVAERLLGVDAQRPGPGDAAATPPSAGCS